MHIIIINNNIQHDDAFYYYSVLLLLLLILCCFFIIIVCMYYSPGVLWCPGSSCVHSVKVNTSFSGRYYYLIATERC